MFPKRFCTPCHPNLSEERAARLKALKIKVVYRKCSIVLLNADGYVQRIKRGTTKPKLLNMVRKPTMFPLVLWFNYVNLFSTEGEEKTLYLKSQLSIGEYYRSGNVTCWLGVD